MRPRTGCELSVWKSSVCERGDRLVIKQFPVFTEARNVAQISQTPFLRFSWLVGEIAESHQKKSSFDGAEQE